MASPRPWPRVDDTDPGALYAWRQAAQERIDSLGGEVRELHGDLRELHRDVSAGLSDLRDRIETRQERHDRCLAAAAQAWRDGLDALRDIAEALGWRGVGIVSVCAAVIVVVLVGGVGLAATYGDATITIEGPEIEGSEP